MFKNKFVFLILMTYTLSAQSKYSIGVGLSACHNYFKTFDPGNQIITKASPAFMINVDVRYQFSKHLSLESGIYIKSMRDGVAFKEMGSVYGNAIPSVNIPIRFIPRFQVVENKLFVNPMFGVSIGLNTNYSRANNGAGFYATLLKADTINKINYEYSVDYKFNPVYLLFQTGLSLEFIFHNRSTLQVQSNFYYGISKISQTNISYQINNDPVVNASSYTNGSFWQIIGVTYLYPMHR